MVDATQIVQLVAQRDRARFATLGKPAPRGVKRELPQVRQAGLPPGCEGDAGHSPSYVPMRSVRGSTRSVRDALEGALAAAYGGAAKKGALKVRVRSGGRGRGGPPYRRRRAQTSPGRGCPVRALTSPNTTARCFTPGGREGFRRRTCGGSTLVGNTQPSVSVHSPRIRRTLLTQHTAETAQLKQNNTKQNNTVDPRSPDKRVADFEDCAVFRQREGLRGGTATASATAGIHAHGPPRVSNGRLPRRG